MHTACAYGMHSLLHSAHGVPACAHSSYEVHSFELPIPTVLVVVHCIYKLWECCCDLICQSPIFELHECHIYLPSVICIPSNTIQHQQTRIIAALVLNTNACIYME